MGDTVFCMAFWEATALIGWDDTLFRFGRLFFFSLSHTHTPPFFLCLRYMSLSIVGAFVVRCAQLDILSSISRLFFVFVFDPHPSLSFMILRVPTIDQMVWG